LLSNELSETAVFSLELIAYVPWSAWLNRPIVTGEVEHYCFFVFTYIFYYKMNPVKIPHDQLSQEALKGVIEEFVTRNGTDYGEAEIPLETKIAQVLMQLKSKDAFIVFDHQSETSTILNKDDQILKSIDS
jgi:uncharacterized protein YheU (UPF0270 family)